MQEHDRLVARMRALAGSTGMFGGKYQALYDAALPWYELWGGKDRSPVDTWMVSPEVYAADLATALEHGRNFIAENPDALFPLAFRATLPGGESISAKYWIKLPAGFASGSGSFPLLVNLHGSGWLGHKISFAKGHATPGPLFDVTPIDEAGPWKIDFLNAFLDKLLATLPIDADRVYVQGHSLGGMATWEWAMDNPERFAAISPRSAIGETYRAVRLKNVPSWVIHGADDNVISRGFAEQMVSALQACGSGVRFTFLVGVTHNMPEDLDNARVNDWYLSHTRSHEAPPADPREGLGLGAAGFSPWELITVPQQQCWKSAPVNISGQSSDIRAAVDPLFARIHARGEMADAPLRLETDAATGDGVVWLCAPLRLRTSRDPDPTLETLPAFSVARFYFRGQVPKALEHARAVAAELAGAGRKTSGKVWVTPLSLWRDSPGFIAEYWVVTPQ
jgi:predicted esterase